jgi:HEAT repeats
MVISLILTISLTDRLLANEESVPKPSWSQEDQKVLQNIHTILVTGSVQTWLNVPAPPYNVGVTLKLKLEDAGFQVVFDPTQPHDANLRIAYEEYPSGQFQVLEQATAIRYRMQLIHDRLGEIFTHEFDAQPNAIPLGSLYWDTIGNLEEDPFYCFVGDLIRGHIQRGQDAEETLMEVLVRPYGQQGGVNPAGARGATQATVQQHARINIIQELGQGTFHTTEAQAVLWTVAKKAQPNERGAAMTQLGEIGDTTFLSPLITLLEKETDPEVRSAGEHAIQLIESR